MIAIEAEESAPFTSVPLLSACESRGTLLSSGVMLFFQPVEQFVGDFELAEAAAEQDVFLVRAVKIAAAGLYKPVLVRKRGEIRALLRRVAV